MGEMQRDYVRSAGGLVSARPDGREVVRHDSDGILAFGALAFAAILTFAIMAGAARAQDHSAGHAQYHDVYRHWLINGTAASCCNAKRTENGVTTGDCYPTVAELRNGVWWARRDTGEWIEIPESRVNREVNPDQTGEAAHLCYSDTTLSVLCFVPPFGGG
jgi:hypothetical protein